MKSFEDFDEPIKRLFALGEEPARAQKWIDYLTLGITKQHIPELIIIINDAEEIMYFDDHDDYYFNSDSPDIYAPIHAWRALGQLKAEEALNPLLDLVIINEELELDWVMEEIPVVMAMLGSAAIPVLNEYLQNPKKLEWASVTATHSLAEIGIENPELRDKCVSILNNTLTNHARNTKRVNGFIISYLIDLNAKETLETVKKAFDADAVDLTIMGDFEDFQLQLGLIKKRKKPARNYFAEEFLSDTGLPEGLKEFLNASQQASDFYNMVDPELKKSLFNLGKKKK